MKKFFTKYRTKYKLIEETEDKPGKKGKPGFRRCQLGAIWATKAHFSSSEKHALINMPTGTGKTGIMIALAFELAANRVFVLAPSVLIRSQTADKFGQLRLLKKIRSLPAKFPDGPLVKEVTSRPTTDAEWRELLDYDVVVATPHTVSPAGKDLPSPARGAAKPPADFFAPVIDETTGRVVRRPRFGLVFVDEAHHSPARTWSAFLDLVTGSKVVYMTATPFRRDRRRIKARPIFNYPISRAMEDGIYSEVALEKIKDDDEDRLDTLLAGKARQLFLEQRELNPHATVIVKAKSIARAKVLTEVYRREGWDNLEIIHSERPHDHNVDVIQRVRRDRGVSKKKWLDGFISVDMGGEGIDIPNLKLAVLHAAPKTLPYTIQLVGRVSRVEKGQAGKAILLANENATKGTEVEELYATDKGWSQILPGLFADRLRRAKYLPGAASRLADIPWLADDDFEPYHSVRVYQNQGLPSASGFFEIPKDDWPSTDDMEFSIFEQRGDTVLAVTTTFEVPEWTSVQIFEAEKHDLHVFRIVGTLLFEFTTSETVCRQIRRHVFDEDLYAPVGYHVIRKALSDAKDGHFFTIGLQNQSGVTEGLPQYKTYMGEDVQAALRTVDGRAFGAGHAVMSKGGRTRGVAINSSRIWSHRRKPLPEFEEWCQEMASLLAAPGSKPIPKIEDKLMANEQISEYPDDGDPVAVKLWDTLLRAQGCQVDVDTASYENPVWRFTNLVLDRKARRLGATLNFVDPDSKKEKVLQKVSISHRLEEPPFWEITTNQEIKISVESGPGEANLAALTLEEFFEAYPPIIVLATGETIVEDILFTPKIQSQRIDPNDLVPQDWDKTDVRRESRPARKDEGFLYNVSQRTIQIIDRDYYLAPTDLLINDDAANEVADLVLIREGRKRITFFHLKYKLSSSDSPGRAREDVSELIDQGIRTGHWIRSPNLIQRLAERVEKNSVVERGDKKQLAKLAKSFFADEWTYSVVLVQPGLSKAQLMRPETPTQTEQLLLGLRDRVTADYGAEFSVWMSG